MLKQDRQMGSKTETEQSFYNATCFLMRQHDASVGLTGGI